MMTIFTVDGVPVNGDPQTLVNAVRAALKLRAAVTALLNTIAEANEGTVSFAEIAVHEQACGSAETEFDEAVSKLPAGVIVDQAEAMEFRGSIELPNG